MLADFYLQFLPTERLELVKQPLRVSTDSVRIFIGEPFLFLIVQLYADAPSLNPASIFFSH